MKGRGQADFVRLPRFAAKLYNSLTKTRAIERQVQEIAHDLLARIEHGRLLDVGTGPGRLLDEMHQRNPELALFGLDISASMVRLAQDHLTPLGVDIRQGSIEGTDYEDAFFDLVTCTGSLYLWDKPVAGLEEVFRILKQGRSAYLFETYKDYDADELRNALRTNLKEETLLRRLITPVFLRKQLRMTYRIDEVAAIIERTRFAGSYSLEKITLGRLPAWIRITLTKGA